MFFRDRPRPGLSDEPAEGQMTQRGLISLAEQIEQRRALREVVLCVRGASAFGMELAAQPKVLAPGGRSGRWIERDRSRGEALFRFGETSG